MPTNTTPSAEPRAITDFNRDVFSMVFFTVKDATGLGSALVFGGTDDIRQFANDLLAEADRFDASGA